MTSKWLPDFFIAGAPKAGTTYIANVLACHPDVFMPVTKEPAFFSRDPRHGHYERGWAFYRKNFHDARDDQVMGEASTLYFHDPESPLLIHEAVPNARIIIVLRNPVDRVYSNYWQYVKSGFPLPPMDTLVEQGGERLEYMLTVSDYPEHLQRFIDTFGRERLLILAHEELSNDPAGVIARILAFIDVRRPIDPACLEQQQSNAAGVPRSRLLARLLRQKPLIQSIKALIPSRFIVPGRRWLDRLRWRNTRVRRNPPLSPSARHYLWQRLEAVPEDVERITGLDVSAWKRDRAASADLHGRSES